jgi:hypothetical protein
MRWLWKFMPIVVLLALAIVLVLIGNSPPLYS